MKRMNLPNPRTLLAFLILAAAPVAWTTGCLAVAAGAAGAGTVAYIRGELNASLNNSLDTVDRATNRAVEQLRFAKINQSSDALSRVITLRTAEDKKIEIRLSRTTDSLTQVRIRVGVFGDETVSRILLDKIKENL